LANNEELAAVAEEIAAQTANRDEIIGGLEDAITELHDQTNTAYALVEGYYTE
jgi:hypothetical protein